MQGLGDFLEFEVVLGEDETEAQGVAIAEDLLEHLEIQRQELVDQAYVDLFNPRHHP